ncbi:hypothetical protein CHLV4139_09095 [Campylobacter helveticus]|uniref:hypothetical protein n=1 Tax=Campylobacter helveticus TaxID=28898 RepID=UPI00214ACFCF|nr:hypothetical protein [Campylobacter helveticus]MCR2055634.1 hypothetical protein [Campylobacter helveticus]
MKNSFCVRLLASRCLKAWVALTGFVVSNGRTGLWLFTLAKLRNASHECGRLCLRAYF